MDAVNFWIFLIGIVLSASLVATLISARFGAPLLLVFLGVGMLAGEDGLLQIQFSNPNAALLIGSIALVIILFDGGMRTHPDRVRVVIGPSAVLATLGVVITCLIIGLAAMWLFDLTLLQGLLLGAILSSTDAAAVFSIFQSAGLNIKERVAATLEVESGSNDPMAVMLTFTLVAVVAGQSELSWQTLLVFFQQALVGALLGWLGGRSMIWLFRKLPLSSAFLPLFAVFMAMALYGLTNVFGGSGFIAVYFAGFLLGNARLALIPQILRMQDGLAWLSQIIMFVMLGLLVTPSKLIDYAVPALGLALVMIFVARPLAVFLSLLPFHFPKRDQLFISWVGLRGAVPIILALIPWISGVENQQLYFNVAFFVVIVSLLIQGWSIAPVARWLKLEVPKETGPDQVMPLEAVQTTEVLQVMGFAVNRDSAVYQRSFEQLVTDNTVLLIGVIRQAEWILPSDYGVFQEQDQLLVLGHASAGKHLSEMLSCQAASVNLDKFDFFGEFVLNAQISLAELGAFYTIDFADVDQQQTIAQYINAMFFRRVVVGDSVQLDQLLLTVRQLDEQGQIIQVGIKSAL